MPPPPKNRDVYNATIKLFGSEPLPPFESDERQIADWGRVWGCDNDVGQLRLALMHRPGDEFAIVDPAKRLPEIGAYGDLAAGWYWQSETIPALAEMQAQHDALADALRAEGVEIVYLDRVEGDRFKSVYTRDVAIAVPGGAVVSRMGPRMRHGEERTAARTLANLGMPIVRTITGDGMLEGGSFAWIRPDLAVVGRGVRVNDSAIAQLRDVLDLMGADLLVVDLPAYSIHLDGWFLMVDRDVCLVDPCGLGFNFLQRLRGLGVLVIETTPADDPWVINGLAVRPGRVLMPEGLTDETRQRLEDAGIEIVTVPYDKVQLNGGGIHCSTCPLVRDRV